MGQKDSEKKVRFLDAFFMAMPPFVAALEKELQAAAIWDDLKCVDHICYRVEEPQRYEAVKKELATIASLLSEALVNGRPIATYKLHTPVGVTDNIVIAIIEVPSPKAGAVYEEGFEHIEAVTKDSLHVFMRKHSHLAFNIKNLGLRRNRDISLTFPRGVVKFHEQSLEEVIALENAEKK